MTKGFDLRRFGRQLPRGLVHPWLVDDDGTFEAFARERQRHHRPGGWSGASSRARVMEQAWAGYAEGYVVSTTQLRYNVQHALENGYLSDQEIAASCPGEVLSWSSMPALDGNADYQGAQVGDVNRLWKTLNELAGWSYEMTDAVSDRVLAGHEQDYNPAHLARVAFRELNAAEKVNWSIDRVHMALDLINLGLSDSSGLELS